MNDRIAKSATALKLGDMVHIELGRRALTVEVLELPVRTPPAQEASKIYRVTEDLRREAHDPDFPDEDW